MLNARSGFRPSRGLRPSGSPYSSAAAAFPAARGAERLGRFFVFGLGLLLLAGFGSGCAVVPVSVGNPIPGMTTVAVAPFFNLSAEPSVDGRRFALAYFTELQKTANYQVIPVGTVELAIRENDLDMSSPADAVKLARILDADAVVVGAVTHYNPYYPPQLGVHIQWYSPREWIFYPGVSTGEERDDEFCPPGDHPPAQGRKPPAPVVRGQSADSAENIGPANDRSAPFGERDTIKQVQGQGTSGKSAVNSPPEPVIWPPGSDSADGKHGGGARAVPEGANGAFNVHVQEATIQPVMSYTRYFDGADRQLIHLLRGYYVLRGDTRSGGWEAYLHRSDDFLQFASHVLVIEMLELHGAPLKTEKVLLYAP